jgi:nitrous oxidase accessory protein NosD
MAGDTVFVRAGTYYEHVVVNKSISLTGENRDTAFIDGNHSGTVLRVTASHVLITNFIIQNSGRLSIT